MTRKYLWITCIIFALVLAWAGAAFAAKAKAIGRFLMLEGQVDVLKNGKLPAVAAKITVPVDIGDVIRTKSKSRAQLLFVDDSVLTLSPESRVAVADFFYDQGYNRRRVLLQLYRGLAHTVVRKILALEGPDFLMHTHTVAIGVRGTEWYTLILPNRTNVYNIEGLLQLQSSNPLIAGTILLQTLQYREVRLNQPPGPAQEITPAILSALRRMMYTGPVNIPPEILGGAAMPPEVEQIRVPESITSPYAPSLSPVHPATPQTPTSPITPGPHP
ncbi:MAG: FecR family protein [Syntrophales bacterium]|nr:FecR family protein [Syntrophales bacterium]MDD5643576.1 FecR family protein [Syntrophales bacterium]